MTIRNSMLASVGMLALLNTQSVAADANLSSETVVVTATRSATALSDVPVSARVITAAQIQDTPAKSLDDILRTIPSVNLPEAASYQLHPTADSVSMRGLGGIRALVLLDGVPLNDPFFGYVQWGTVPVEDIQRVEVVRGGGATLWGNYAMGGVINIITRVPDKEGFGLEAGGGSYGTYRANGYAAFVLSDHARINIDAGTNGTDGYRSVPTAFRTPLDVPTSSQAHNIQSTLQFDLDPTLSGTVRAGYHDFDQTLYTAKSTNFQTNWNFAGELKKTFDSMSVTGTVFHNISHFRTDNTDTPPGATPGFAEFVQNRHMTPVTATGGSLLWSMTTSNWLRLLSAGGDYQEIHGTDVANIYNASNTKIRTDIGRGNQRFAGLFVQADIAPLQNLEILASARYQYFQNYKGFDGAPGGLGNVPDQSTSSFDPRVSAKYALSDEFAVRAAAYKAFRAPTLDNLYRAFSTPSGIFYGNPALKPETLTGYEGGLDFNFGNIRGQVTYYYSTVKNLLTSRNLDFSELPPGFFFGSRNINAGSARAQGVEAEASWNVMAHLEATLAYTYANSVITNNPLDPASVGLQLGGVPSQSASGQLAYTGEGGWRVSTRLRWVDKSWSDNDHTLAIDPHFVVDVSASYPINDHLEPFVQVENLFARHYIADNSGFSAPQLGTPQSVFAGLRVKY